uniref:Putative head tail connector protein n=1 Tax=viral metagenome TaxID=1070528 RepID=A0A6M3KW89_9ZZZZ
MPNLLGDGSNLVDDKTFEGLLIETFTPKSPTRTTDDQGSSTIVWTAGTAFPGRLSRLSAQERMAQDKETALATHKIYCLTDVDVDSEDQIFLGSRTFIVAGVLRPSNLTTDGHLEINVREVDYEL